VEAVRAVSMELVTVVLTPLERLAITVLEVQVEDQDVQQALAGMVLNTMRLMAPVVEVEVVRLLVLATEELEDHTVLAEVEVVAPMVRILGVQAAQESKDSSSLPTRPQQLLPPLHSGSLVLSNYFTMENDVTTSSVEVDAAGGWIITHYSHTYDIRKSRDDYAAELAAAQAEVTADQSVVDDLTQHLADFDAAVNAL